LDKASLKRKRIAHIAGGLTTGGVEAMIYNYFSSILSFAGDGEYELVYIST
jgi:hypothetical protein